MKRTSQYVEPYSDQVCSFRHRPSGPWTYLSAMLDLRCRRRLVRVGVGERWYAASSRSSRRVGVTSGASRGRKGQRKSGGWESWARGRPSAEEQEAATVANEANRAEEGAKSERCGEGRLDDGVC